ncbi:hypothetical protein RFI_18483 [Reticulomyxa filosa]|uniref:Uncharacterized protein n=1 Tax=Reticulomyxa filosa TaxID=46433 RepID=X6MXL7_RETFI|nr:hypothetical protein RFI_18483 [Reticulomyxa filosa]|eukprot:ETO18770.1 hypothetical protein RFI_18483 [Reticulomyxa filosa]
MNNNTEQNQFDDDDIMSDEQFSQLQQRYFQSRRFYTPRQNVRSNINAVDDFQSFQTPSIKNPVQIPLKTSQSQNIQTSNSQPQSEQNLDQHSQHCKSNVLSPDNLNSTVKENSATFAQKSSENTTNSATGDNNAMANDANDTKSSQIEKSGAMLVKKDDSSNTQNFYSQLASDVKYKSQNKEKC